MFLAYVFSLVVGGVFLGVSSLFGSKDVDAGHGGGDLHAMDASHHGAEVEASWVPFLSLQFWMFALAFFGLTGTVLEGFGLAGGLVTAGSAVGLGLAAGLSASYALHRLRHDKVESNVGASDFIGRNATALLPIAKGQNGKIRVQVKGQLVDLTATTEDDDAIGARDEVMVIEMREHIAVVERRDRAEGEPVPAAAARRQSEGGK
jgi:membrane protein implicated in regulation of membrane protease activity